MNAITQFLLASVALGALATAPALAGDAPHFGLMAQHPGHAINKTKVRDPNRIHLTYTYAVYSSVPASDLRQTVKLPFTYYRWNSLCFGYDCASCTNPKQKLKTPKQSIYAKLGKATESYSYGCPSGLTVFYGDTYKLTDKAGFGKTDHFVSSLIGWPQNLDNGMKYKATMNMDVSVAIGE